MPLILALGRQREMNLCEFRASLSYISETIFQRKKEGGREEGGKGGVREEMKILLPFLSL